VLWLRRAVLGVFFSSIHGQIESDVYSQIGLVDAIGLAAKNAILIVVRGIGKESGPNPRFGRLPPYTRAIILAGAPATRGAGVRRPTARQPGSPALTWPGKALIRAFLSIRSDDQNRILAAKPMSITSPDFPTYTIGSRSEPCMEEKILPSTAGAATALARRQTQPRECSQDAEWQRPTFVTTAARIRKTNSKEKSEDRPSRYAFSRFLLDRHTRIVEAHCTGHRRLEDIFQRAVAVVRAIGPARRLPFDFAPSDTRCNAL